MTQRQRVREYLESGQVLTRLNSWDKLGVIETPARISELRREGVPVITRMKSVTNRFGDRVNVAEWSLDLSH